MMNKIYLTGEIDELSIQPVLDFLKENENAPVIIHIDSIGGDVFAGLQLCRAIANHKAEVIAECGIIVASIASVIALSCTKMTITKDTFLMVHKPWCVCCGTAEELLSTAALLEQSGKRIKEIVNEKTKEGIDTETWFTCDTWFGYEEILNCFNDVALEENVEINTKVLTLTNKLKSAPEALVAIAAKLQVEEEQQIEDDAQTTINEDDSEEGSTEDTNTDEDSEVSVEETDEVETEETAEEEKEEQQEEVIVDNSLAVSVINKLNKLNIC
jgi:ATP-dependent protease ClpP protease subunit